MGHFSPLASFQLAQRDDRLTTAKFARESLLRQPSIAQRFDRLFLYFSNVFAIQLVELDTTNWTCPLPRT
jgi:hypothetical protein